MKDNMNIYYDEEGYFLEIGMGKSTEGYFKNRGKGVFERVDVKTNKVIGIAIMGFKKRTGKLKSIEVSLPLKLERQ